MTGKASASLPLQKTNDQHAFGDGKQVSPALCSMGDAAPVAAASGARPTNAAVAPNTLSQPEAATHGHHLLPGPKDLVDGIVLPLTLEGIQVNCCSFLVENIPVAKPVIVVKTSTLQSQELLMPSLVSAPCKTKLTQDQSVDVTFPSQTVQLNTENTVISEPVTVTRAADPIPGAKSIEIECTVALEKDAPLKQFLSPEIKKSTLEEHDTPQLSNLKKKETAAFSQTIAAQSLQSPSPKETQKKPFVGSWVKGLLSKGASFMPPCVLAQNRNTIADLQPSVKGASNFGGFKTKRKSQKDNRASKKARRCASPAAGTVPPSQPPSAGLASERAEVHAHAQGARKCEDASSGAQLGHSSPGNVNGVSSSDHGDSAEGQIHKLRLKLLKKLKAKKKKLAALMSSSQNGKLPSENLEQVSQCDSPNDSESIEDLLKELQYQIDLADNKSAGTTIPDVSPFGDQTHEEILAELLSPTTVVSTDLSENAEAGLRYLEMGGNQSPAPGPSELNSAPSNTHLRQDHNYCSPTKKTQSEVQPEPLTHNACVRTSSLESSMKTDIFYDFFSTSTLNSLANDTLDLAYFDEYLFESC